MEATEKKSQETIMAKTVRLAILLSAACVLSISCERAAILHVYRHTPSEGWEQSDVLTYNVDTIRHTGDYAFNVGVRTTNAYPYKKLWVIVEKQLSNPLLSEADTLVCNFVNSEEDRDGWGTNTYQYIFSLGKIHLEEGQTGKISIRHIMRREILPGVSDIGIKISH